MRALREKNMRWLASFATKKSATYAVAWVEAPDFRSALRLIDNHFCGKDYHRLDGLMMEHHARLAMTIFIEPPLLNDCKSGTLEVSNGSVFH